MYIFLGFIAGFLGIAIGLFSQIAILANFKSFGVSYLAPYTPFINSKDSISYMIPPIWKRERRSDFLNTNRPKEQPHISQKWKFWKGVNN